MLTNFNSSNPVIVQFPRFAGGKFISNCLALSKHAVPQDSESATYLLDNPNDYEYRLSKILNTIPPLTEMTDWIEKYEFGDYQLYGDSFVDWTLHGTPSSNTITDKLSNAEFLKFFIVNHSGPMHVANLLNVWPNAQIILLTNFTKFFNISSKLKSTSNESLEHHAGNYCFQKYNKLRGDTWPNWEEFETALYNTNNLSGYDISVIREINEYYTWNSINKQIIKFDIDNSIFELNNFLSAIELVYTQLNFTDFNPKLVETFWKQYIALHR